MPKPNPFAGTGLFARALRGSAFTAGGYALSQGMRLVSNLILTRLLFPEAFGLMALVSVFLVGLAMFSDVGVGPAIAQNKRGDEPDFLNTAWTIQVLRGLILWLATCALAVPAAHLYEAPLLAHLLPVAGVTLLINGFNPTRIDTANRHLLLGRVTALDLASQAIAIGSMLLLAWATSSVWALVVGAILGAISKLALMHWCLPGAANRFRWEPEAGRDLIHFGKWIFLSTAAGFLLWQGDKAILGDFLPLDQFGIYNIGYFLASFPVLLAGAVVSKIFIPLYRDHPPAASEANRAKLARLRYGLTCTILALLAVMGFVGVPLVELLYDPRYEAAGAIAVLIACVQMPVVVGMSYEQAALANGDSRNFFVLVAAKAGLQTSAFIFGAMTAGLVGALVAQGIALTLAHGPVIWLARKHNVWDPRHDLIGATLALCLAAVSLWLHRADIATLAG